MNSSNAAINITAADLTLTGTLNSGTATTTIQAAHGRTVGLGDATADMTIDGTELSNITSGALTIGGTTTGNITVDNVATTSQQGLLTLLAECAISRLTFSGNGSQFQALTGSATGEIAVNATVTAAGAISLTSSASDVALTAAVTSTVAGNIDVTGLTGIVLDTIVSSAGGNITFYSPVLLTGSSAVSAGSGNVTFAKTVDGAFSLGVNTGGVTAFDGAVGGTTALTSLTTDAAGSTDLNGGPVSGTISIQSTRSSRSPEKVWDS